MLEWMVSSSLLILAVLAARRLLGERISGTARYALWLVVLARLLIPVQLFSAPVSLGALLPESPAVEEVLDETALYAFPDPELSGTFDEPLPEDAPTGVMAVGTHGQRILGAWVEYHDGCTVQTREGWTGYRFYADWRDVLILFYLAGAAVMLGVLTVSNLRFARRLRRRRVPFQPPFPYGNLPVYTVEGLSSPCLCGVVFPKIYVTGETAADTQMLRHVLSHEEAHYVHKDHIWSLLRCLALALHWYNLLVWWAAAASRQDGELACDQRALAYLGEWERTAYGRTLLSLLTARPRPGDLLQCATTMSGGGRKIKERLERIVKAPRMLAVTAVCLALAAVCLGGIAFSGRSSAWVEDPRPEARFLYDRTERGESVVETLQFRVEDDAEDLEDLKAVNQSIRDFAQSFTTDNEGQWAKVSAYPCVGRSTVTILELGCTMPTYSTDGTLAAWCWDTEGQRLVTLEEVRKALNWSDSDIRMALEAYVEEHPASFGYGAGESTDGAEFTVAGFRQRMDGGWDLFLQYQRPATATSAGYQYLLTFSDGAILPGLAIPEEELADVGCALKGLTAYSTEDRVEEPDMMVLLAFIQPEDLVNIVGNGIPAGMLASALRNARIRPGSAPADRVWSVTVYLEGGPEEWSSFDAHLTLWVGLTEGNVLAEYCKGPCQTEVRLESQDLYWLIRNAWDEEETVDQEALTIYRTVLEDRMDSSLAQLQRADAQSEDPAGYNGYQVTQFYAIGTFEDVSPGVDAELYAFDYGITMEHPENMSAVGANYLDGKLRMRSYRYPRYFLVYRQEGEVVRTLFLNWEKLHPAFLQSDLEDMERSYRETLLYFWKLSEAD